MRGKQIKTLTELVQASLHRRSTIGAFGPEPRPAAILVNMQGIVIYRLLERGLYLYEKPKKKPWKGAGGGKQ